ncbi:hypothetical protein [Bradyrhizobium sp. ORS 111]|uniref:hypothetical protein n=1 Tax=Bradyrhizobium sp. ORS 111 TaxID=1685958 RepID=UPI00388E63F6
MKRLIMTSSSGSSLIRSGLAEVGIISFFRFVGGPLPSPKELEVYFGLRSDQDPVEHWSHWSLRGRWPQEAKSRRDLALIEFCDPYETIELWFDPDPNDQLQLIWLLDHFRAYPATAAKLKLRLVAFGLMTTHETWGEWDKVPLVNVRPADIETASMCWQAYRTTTPEACFDVVHRDLSAFPLLRPALLDLLQELPWSTSGLGATEMRLLELIAAGLTRTNALFYLRGFRQRGVLTDMEVGTLLQGLAHGPQPAIAGLDDELRVIAPENLRNRMEAYRRSRLSLTEFGKAVLAHEEDFSSYNPIDRWWGGTHLTNDNLWRWSPALTKT